MTNTTPPLPPDPDPDEHDDHPVIPDLWDRMEAAGETERAYAAFLAYRNLPPAGRSHRAVVPIVYGIGETDPKFRSKLGQIQHWSSEWDWVARAAAWDRWQADTQAAGSVAAIIAMRERHATIAQAAIRKAVEQLQAFNGRMTVTEIIRLLDLGLRTERLARGDHDGRVTVTHQGTGDGGAIQVNTRGNDNPDTDQLVEVVGILVETGMLPAGSTEAVRGYLDAATGTDTPAD